MNVFSFQIINYIFKVTMCFYLSYNFDKKYLSLSLTVFEKNVLNFLSDSSCIHVSSFSINPGESALITVYLLRELYLRVNIHKARER